MRKFSETDWPFFLLALGLTIFGLLMVYNASSATALLNFGDKYYFLKDQLKFAILGIMLSLGISVIDYKRIFYYSPYFLLGTIILLVLVFIPGIGMNIRGASRWINLRLFTLQPSEITKLAYIIYLSAWFSTKDKSKLFSFIILTVIVVGLVILQPDMGTAIILASVAIVMYFLSEEKIWKVGIIFLSIMPLGAVLALKSSYRLKRIMTFLDSKSDPLGSSYHIRQAIISLGSGGIFGLGLGNSRQKYFYLPEATTDSIFAILGEELGLLGVMLFLFFISMFVYRGAKLAMLSTHDRFGQMLIIGIISWIAVQTVVNLSSMVALLPLTGVPLPFISYGGSSLVTQWIGVGIILSVSRSIKR